MTLDEDEVRALWDGNADVWAEGVRSGADVSREHYNNPAFFALIGDVRGLDVLDAGCGEGTNTRKLAELGARVVAFDLSPRMIALARAREAERPLGIEYRVGSFVELKGVPDASFDLVVSTMALMDAPDLDGALRAFSRVLRPGGRLAFSITHPCFTNAVAGWEGDAVLRIAGYAGLRPMVEAWRFRAGREDAPPFRVAVYPRTLSEIVASVIESGFVLRALREPVATEEACARIPQLARHRSIPHFLHVLAER